jgi:DNA (cytosine-5)-methyltransferase 1
MSAYYNEIDLYAAQWLRNLMAKGLIPDGEVDTRSIVDVTPDDIRKFTQCHFFAGIGGWGHALRLAGWSDDRPIWTGSCPCQPFSSAGKRGGTDDPRHLWPHFHRLISAVRPPVVMGEQVAGQAGYGWFDGVQADLETIGYAGRAVDIPALAVNAPHIRQRLYWIAKDMEYANVSHGKGVGISSRIYAQDNYFDSGSTYSNMADAKHFGLNGGAVQGSMGKSTKESGMFQSEGLRSAPSFWSDHIWLTGADGKARRTKPGLPLLAHGVPNRVGRLRAYGNAIVPQVAAEVIRAFMESDDV